jgi:hypothetical protein
MSKIIARIAYQPDDDGPVAVIRERNDGTYTVFWNGGFWSDGDAQKRFKRRDDAMLAVSREIASMAEEGM